MRKSKNVVNEFNFTQYWVKKLGKSLKSDVGFQKFSVEWLMVQVFLLENDIEKLQLQKRKSSFLNEDLRKEKVNLERKIEKMRNELDKIENRMRDGEVESGKLRIQLRLSRNEKKNLENEKENLKNENENMKKQNKEIIEKNRKSAEMMKMWDEVMSDMEKRDEEGKVEMMEFKGKVKNVSEKFKDRIKKLKKEKKLLTDKNNEWVKVKNKLEDELEQAKNVRKLKLRESKNLRRALEESFEMKNNENVKMIEDLLNQLENERRIVEKKEQEIVDMRKEIQSSIILETISSGFKEDTKMSVEEKKVMIEELKKKNFQKVLEANKSIDVFYLELVSLNIREEIGLCNICFDRKVEIIYKPCNHAVTCKLCSEKLIVCQNCRAKIEKKERVFF